MNEGAGGTIERANAAATDCMLQLLLSVAPALPVLLVASRR